MPSSSPSLMSSNATSGCSFLAMVMASLMAEARPTTRNPGWFSTSKLTPSRTISSSSIIKILASCIKHTPALYESLGFEVINRIKVFWEGMDRQLEKP